MDLPFASAPIDAPNTEFILQLSRVGDKYYVKIEIDDNSFKNLLNDIKSKELNSVLIGQDVKKLLSVRREISKDDTRLLFDIINRGKIIIEDLMLIMKDNHDIIM